jgi:tetratricopeptide (TPR) repeat protein
MIYQVVCDRLETVDRMMDAAECFHQLVGELEGDTHSHDEQEKWARGKRLRILCQWRRSCDRRSLDFKYRCCAKLENTGDVAADAQRYDVAISHYSAALSLDPARERDIFIKRSKAHMSLGLWEDALDDANQACHFPLVLVHSFNAKSSGYRAQFVVSVEPRKHSDRVDPSKFDE